MNVNNTHSSSFLSKLFSKMISCIKTINRNKNIHKLIRSWLLTISSTQEHDHMTMEKIVCLFLIKCEIVIPQYLKWVHILYVEVSEGGEENVVNAKRCHFINVLACNKKSDFVFFYSSAGLAVYCHSATIGPEPKNSHILTHIKTANRCWWVPAGILGMANHKLFKIRIKSKRSSYLQWWISITLFILSK